MRFIGYCKDCHEGLVPPRGTWGAIDCPGCGKKWELTPSPAILEGKAPDRCALCGHDRWHIRKDFNRQLGLFIVGIACVLTILDVSPPGFFWLPLVVASLIDLGLYYIVPWKVVCYVCEAEYRRAPLPEGVAPYDLHVATECKRLKWPKTAEAIN